MKSILNYLDDLKEKNGSDYKTAQMLKITKESVSQIRKRGTVSDETAVKMADLLKINQSEVLIAAAIARSEGDVKSAWERISKMTGIAASVLLTVLITLPNIGYLDIKGASFANNIHYAQCLLFGGVVIALGMVLVKWSQKHDGINSGKESTWSKKEVEFLSGTLA